MKRSMNLLKLKSLLAIFILASCTAPTITAVSDVPVVPTNTKVIPTVTVTPGPEPLGQAKDLSQWLDNFVHAYGGTVTVNDTEMNADQLATEVQANPDSFLQVRQINGVEYSFLVVNGIPLALRKDKAKWTDVGYKDLAPARMTVGASFAVWTGDYDDDLRYRNVFAANFNLIATDGSLSEYDLLKNIPNDVRLAPQQVIDLYDWTDFDKIAAFADEHELPLRAMHLYSSPVVGMNTPEWLSRMSDEQLREYLKMHVAAILERAEFADASPANEAFYGAGMPGNNFFYSRLGEEYIEIAFQTAHEMSPDAALILNDNIVYGPQGQGSDDGVWTNTVINGESNAIFDFVKKEVSKGLPIHGVGIESHLIANDFVSLDTDGDLEEYRTDLLRLMKQYQAIGVDVYFTELDVNIAGLPADWSDQRKQDLKAKIYRAVFDACLSAENCRSVTTWGFSDTATWMLTPGYPFGMGESPLPMDKNYLPTISNYEIKRVLFEYWH